MTNLANIRVDSLRGRSRQFSFAEPVAAFEALAELAETGQVQFVDPVAGTLKALMAGELIEIDGQLTVQVEQPCSRCLAPVCDDLAVDVSLAYVRAGEDATDDHESERELSSEELGLIPYHGDEIDLHPELAQEIIMALPQRPLCKEECRGLCPVCGGDLNQIDCNCQPPLFHAGLAVLKNFKAEE